MSILPLSRTLARINPTVPVQVPVQPYVAKFLAHQYGAHPGNQHYRLTRDSDLGLSLLNLGFSVEIVPQVQRLPGVYIQIDLGDDAKLLTAFERNRPWMEAGAFFQHEFNQALRTHLDAQRQLANVLELSEKDWNARIGLELFMQRYGITNDEYDYDSLRRHMNRLNKRPQELHYEGGSYEWTFGGRNIEDFTAPTLEVDAMGIYELRWQCKSNTTRQVMDGHMVFAEEAEAEAAFYRVADLLKAGYILK